MRRSFRLTTQSALSSHRPSFEIVSDYSIEGSVQRLSDVVNSFTHGDRIVGRVAADNVVLRRVIPGVGNGFKPIFYGQFATRNGKTHLRGEFTMSGFAKAFLTIWFGLFAILMLMIGYSYVSGGGPNEVTLAVLLLIVVVCLFIFFAMRSSRGDTHLITTQLTEALQKNEAAAM